jgi:LysM repeat protein
MSGFGSLPRWVAALIVCMLACGCSPVGDTQADEQKEPHFLRGRSLFSAFDYQGAIDEYEKSLEVRPHSASAHFELACAEEKVGDYASAIYHYQKYLRDRPNADNADVVHTHISSCKSELAMGASELGPAAAGQDLAKVLAENRDLKEQLARWQAAYAAVAAAQARVSAVPPGPPAPNPGPARAGAAPSAPPESADSGSDSQRTVPVPPAGGVATSGPRPSAAAAAVRTCTVREHETVASIARRYGVPLSALLAANPEVEPRHLRVGQTLNIPAP